MYSKFRYSKFLPSISLQRCSILTAAGRRARKEGLLRKLQPESICWRLLSFSSKSWNLSSNRYKMNNNIHNNNNNNNNNRKNNHRKNHTNYEQRRKTIPKLIYLHNPWKYFVNRLNMLKIHLFWDREFSEKEFIRGSKQAAIVITDIIRNQNASRIGQFTTPIGFQQISRDMILSRKDKRLQLVHFEVEHLRRAIPMKVVTRKKFGRSYCFIDMLFVGLRNIKDFETTEEIVKVNKIIRHMDTEYRTPPEATSAPHRIVFAEIFMRFRKEYTELSPESDKNDWFVSFYKILSFDVINYDPR